MNTNTEVVILFKKTIVILVMFLVAISGLLVRLYFISADENISQAAASQSSYKISVGRFRGTIYDCNNEAMVNNGKVDVKAAILPSVNSLDMLHDILDIEEMNSIYNLMSSGKPFLIDLPETARKINNQDIQCFDVQQRYQEQALCPHFVGYVDGSGKGVSGIELSYDDYLGDIDSEISVSYKVDALGRALLDQSPKVKNTEYLKMQGVSLTIDNKVQKIAEEAAKKYIKKGAVVVTEIPNCEIRAALSLPTYSPLDISSALEDEASAAMLNRAVSSYNLGSVFKLVTAAAGLENGLDSEAVYNCTGSTTVDGVTFHCFNGIAHGEVNMEKAIAYSCNCYFIDLAQKMSYIDVYKLAEDLGLNKEQELAPDLVSAKGSLPEPSKLRQFAPMANFSFGQGELLTTPLQVNGMVNAIAANGVYTEPKLVTGLVDPGLNLVEEYGTSEKKEVISSFYADKIKDYMKAAVEYGTAKEGKPTDLSAGAKTGTAETGKIVNGKEIIQCWYSGFYPADKPKYVITVFAEDGIGPSQDCAPVFKEIVDKLK